MYTINVVGTGWAGQTIATTYTAPADVPADELDAWLNSHSGDFQSITDYLATLTERCSQCGHHTFTTLAHDWQSEEAECTHISCLYPPDEDALTRAGNERLEGWRLAPEQ